MRSSREATRGALEELLGFVHLPPLAPIGPHWPPFAIPKCANKIIKLVVSAIFKQTCEFHFGLLDKKINNVSFTFGFIIKVSKKLAHRGFGSAKAFTRLLEKIYRTFTDKLCREKNIIKLHPGGKGP